MSMTLSHYLGVSAVLFVTGVCGVLLRRNLLVVLLSVELMLNAAILAFVAFSRALGNMDGQMIALFAIAAATAGAIVGLAIMLVLFKVGETPLMRIRTVALQSCTLSVALGAVAILAFWLFK